MRMSSSLQHDFNNTVSAPAAKASLENPVKEVNINIGTDGMRSFSTRAASSPFMTGMDKSRTIASGCNRRASSMPDLPFSASPQTVKSGTPPSTRLMARRTVELSSTIRISVVTIDVSSTFRVRLTIGRSL